MCEPPLNALAKVLFPVLDDDGNLFVCLVQVGLDFTFLRRSSFSSTHNELGQAVLGAEESDIIEVLDHHRLGGSLKSSQPIRFINEPVGSTCTLVARQFRAAGITPTPGIALCMAAGIISDTLFFAISYCYRSRSKHFGMAERALRSRLRDIC